MRERYLLLAVLAFYFINPLLGYTQSESTLTPTADTFVRGDEHSTTNYGTDATLECKLGASSDEWTREVYVKFDLSTITDLTIVSATLRLKVETGSGSQDTHTSHFVADDSWGETTINWDNKPVLGSEIESKLNPSKDDWLEMDMTDLVAGEFAGDQTFSIALTSNGEATTAYYSKEAESAADYPQLVVVTSNDVTAPDAPTGLVANESSDSQIDLSWTDNVEGDLSHYFVSRSTDGGSTYTVIVDDLNVNTYSDQDLTPSTTYHYTVSAVDDSRNESDASSAAFATTEEPPLPPDAPSGLTITSHSKYEIALSWTDNSATERGFSLERKSTDDFVEIASIDEDQQSYSDTGLNPSTSYTYRIRAFNAGGDSDYSNEVSETTEAPSSYYIDAISGNDSNDGLSEATPWKTLEKVSTWTFNPGEQVLFKTGSVWNERLSLHGSGVEGSPIIVDKYGSGNLPIFNGGGGSGADPTVLLENEEYWEINNLEITNSDGSATYQSDLWGIRVDVTEAGEFNHIYIRNCYIHMINGEVSLVDAPNEGKETGGISVTVSSSASNPAWYKDLKIQNNRIGGDLGGDLVSGMGISTQSTHGAIQKGEDRKLFLEVVVTDNVVGPTGRNNCVVRVSDKALVEHNLFKESSRFMTGHSVYNYNTLDFVIQYNEAYGNVGPATDKDRGGYDADYQAQNTYIQYNYSHDNNWTLGIMKRATNENVVFRYNIAQNDKLSVFRYGFNQDRGLTDAHVYNNTFYVSADYNIEVFGIRTALNTEFYNNIFYFEGEATWGTSSEGLPINCTFENNLFYNLAPKGTNYLTANPQLVEPGTAGQDIDWDDYPDILLGYKLQATSPCIDAGKVIEDNGGFDFWGNELYNGTPDIGAHEFAEEKIPLGVGELSPQIEVYPNPFIDLVKFNLPTDAESVVIYDMLGSVIANLKTENNSNTLTWRPTLERSNRTLIYQINRSNGEAITGKLIRISE